jgi:superfamily II DNA or RNA helicase
MENSYNTNKQPRLSLYKHQIDVLDRNPPRYGLFHSTGTGKTITGISLANINCSSVLVVVPKTNKGDWEANMKLHCNVPEWRVITKEEFKREAPTLKAYHGVIIDEGHHFAGIKSQLSKTMMAYLKKHNVIYRWIMTATPYLSTPLNIYTLARLLGHEWNYGYFTNQFFYKINMGGRMITKQKPNTEKELSKLVRAIGETIDIGELVVLPEQKYKTVYLEMMEPQVKAIMELDEPVFITRWTKKHQIENGFQYHEDGTRNYVNEKSEWILKEIPKHKKIAIFCRYKEQIAQYKSLIKYMYPDLPVFELHGDIKDRYTVIHEADEAPEAIILIQSECSAGYELPSFAFIIFASLSFSYVSYVQGLGRFLRINKLKENTYVHLVVDGVDSDIYDCIMRKEDFSISLYKGI